MNACLDAAQEAFDLHHGSSRKALTSAWRAARSAVRNRSADYLGPLRGPSKAVLVSANPNGPMTLRIDPRPARRWSLHAENQGGPRSAKEPTAVGPFFLSIGS